MTKTLAPALARHTLSEISATCAQQVCNLAIFNFYQFIFSKCDEAAVYANTNLNLIIIHTNLTLLSLHFLKLLYYIKMLHVIIFYYVDMYWYR